MPAFWWSLRTGRYGIRPLTRFDTSAHRQKIGGEVEGFALSETPDPALQFARAAALEAATMARLEEIADRSTVAVVTASNFGAMEEVCRLLAGKRNGERLAAARFGRASETVAEALDATGPKSAISLSCSSGNAALGYALDLLRATPIRAVVVVGYDAISELAWSGLTALRTMTTNLIRPFDARRDGTIFSEGAGALVLERGDNAEQRGVECLAEILGHGTNNNAFHMAHPDACGEGMARAMTMALEDAAVAPDEVDHINAHGTGTKYNDPTETQAIKKIFGERARRIPICSIKSMLGHAMGAASALEAIATVLTLREGIIPPTIHLEVPDPECDLDYVPNQARAHEVRIAISNSAGIGGPNSVVVLGRWAETRGGT